MNRYLLAKHMFCVGSQRHVLMLHVYCVIPLHKSPSVVPFFCVDVDDVVSGAGFIVIPPKKNHALKRMIVAGINILNTIFFTNLY